MSLITGPGRYLTRGGEEVDVFQSGDISYPWAYRLLGGQISVDDDGYQLGSKYPSYTDIVAKAPEAAPTKEKRTINRAIDSLLTRRLRSQGRTA